MGGEGGDKTATLDETQARCMILHWYNNELLTHIGEDYLRCDIWDFEERKIRPGEVVSVRYLDRGIKFGALAVIAACFMPLVGIGAFEAFRKSNPDLTTKVCVGGVTLLFAIYLVQRARHCLTNRRRTVLLTLTDGTSGTLLELEDDRLFREVRSIVDRYAPSAL